MASDASLKRGNRSKNDVIRTDFLLENIFSHMLGDKYKFNPISPMNKKEKDILEKVTEIYDLFGDQHGHSMASLCEEFHLTENTIEPIVLGVANCLFSEVITWNYIICYFYFVGQLTMLCIHKNLPKSTVDIMYECFSRLVKNELESWIEDNGDWEHLLSLTINYEKSSPIEIRKSSWIKSLWYSIIKIVGTVSFILNDTF